jgi:hypothetical protein
MSEKNGWHPDCCGLVHMLVFLQMWLDTIHCRRFPLKEKWGCWNSFFVPAQRFAAQLPACCTGEAKSHPHGKAIPVLSASAQTGPA